MKFDLDTAWKDTTRLLRDNFSLLAVVAGVFYFIPYAAALLWIPGLAELTMGQFDPSSPETEAMANEMFAGYWWALVLLGIVQGIGLLAMLALLKRRASPTVGQAISAGGKSVLSYIAAQLLQAVILAIVIFLLIGLPVASGLTPLAIIGGIAGLVVVAYVLTKLSIAAPIIAIDGQLNPVSALTRSWHLTKGNSVRLFFFYFLLLVAYIVISTIVSMVFALLFAMGGAEVQSFGQAISASLMNALLALFFAGVLAAIHTQLTRLHSTSADRNTASGD
ncbi:glycerophosphoryl diester phosphodiesterase membrane domain-containing protein [Qipengyuania huizhouensis]|uniref:glycerophosphoryl diester phosphodiesterase membrane domain-containing protein n=1 Tax=Qipengyuania huizhouensis TaxID=2867245 RepID=UPI001C874333|nr:glycerophosphoryl diester phosphodiesterase membrane domain-containing protein [Qipengyuania huizhouensis]MBX7459618.1 glycerophosphoryl diester phosphodiesterase membrane domain-containing protein [Qipengyuania huizhouensis]